jgi:hypothetical protein
VEWARWSFSAGLENAGRYSEQLFRIDPLFALSHFAQGRSRVMSGHGDDPFMRERSRLLAGLRGEPEFEALMTEVKARWETLVSWERGLEPGM